MRELDLHGHTWKEALEEFEAECKGALEQIRRNPAKIRVIHGYGAQVEGGVIRDRQRAFCGRYDDRLEHTRGEDIDGNKGMTEIRVLKPPPVALERLGERVLEYCRNGRTVSEIEGRFRHSGASVVGDAVALLRKQGRLERARNKRGRTVYVAL